MVASINRRTAMGLATVAILLSVCTLAQSADETIRVYLGTFTRKGRKGIYLSKLNLATGRLKPTGSEITVSSPVCVKFHAAGQ
jgi:hypothetical protein